MVALNEAGKVRVTWSRRTLGSGQVITGYSVQYRGSGTTSYTTRSVSGSSTTSYTITNLNLGTVYEVRVASVGPLGLSRYCCGSGKEVMTYNCEYNALKVHAVHSTVCHYVRRSLPSTFVYARAISMGFSFTFICNPGQQDAWLMLCWQVFAYNCNDMSAIQILLAISLNITTQPNDTSTVCVCTSSPH